MQSSSTAAALTNPTATKSASTEISALLLSLLMPPIEESSIEAAAAERQMKSKKLTIFDGNENLLENETVDDIYANRSASVAGMFPAMPTPAALFAGFAAGNETITAFEVGMMEAAADEPCQSVNDALAAAPFNDWTTRPYVLLLFALLYILVLTVGIIGNVFVVVAVARTRSLRTASNWFILTLSASDIAACLISGTVTPITAFRKECKSEF